LFAGAGDVWAVSLVDGFEMTLLLVRLAPAVYVVPVKSHDRASLFAIISTTVFYGCYSLSMQALDTGA
jgi:hypothetical protein